MLIKWFSVRLPVGLWGSMNYRRYTIFILICAILLTGCGNKAYKSITDISRIMYQKKEYQITPVQTGDLEPILKLKLARQETEKISYSVDESDLEMEEILVSIGDHVSAGQMLISFKSEEIKKNIEKYSGEVTKKQLLLDHYKRMYNVDYTDRDEKYAVILEELEDDVELAKLYLAEEQARFDKCQIKAERDGIISFISKNIVSGIAEPGETLVTQICGQTRYTANTKDSYTFNIGDVYEAQTVEASYDMEVVDVIDESDFSRTVVFVPLDDSVEITEDITMDIKKGKLSNCIYVPKLCVYSKNDKKFVYIVKEDGFLEGRFVETGEEIDDWVVIKSGLDGTEEVAYTE